MESGDQIITLYTYYDPMLAHIARTRLEDAGVCCFIADENLATVYPLYNTAIGGIKLKIFARDMEKCQAILAEDESAAVDDLAAYDDEMTYVLTCPYCGSDKVEQDEPADGNNRILSAITSFFNPIGNTENWHCLNCGKHFE